MNGMEAVRQELKEWSWCSWTWGRFCDKCEKAGVDPWKAAAELVGDRTICIRVVPLIESE